MSKLQFYKDEDPNFPIGTLVSITHAVPNDHLGWNNDWVKEMDICVGHVYEVAGQRPRGEGYELTPHNTVSYPEAPDTAYCSFPHWCMSSVANLAPVAGTVVIEPSAFILL